MEFYKKWLNNASMSRKFLPTKIIMAVLILFSGINATFSLITEASRSQKIFNVNVKNMERLNSIIQTMYLCRVLGRDILMQEDKVKRDQLYDRYLKAFASLDNQMNQFLDVLEIDKKDEFKRIIENKELYKRDMILSADLKIEGAGHDAALGALRGVTPVAVEFFTDIEKYIKSETEIMQNILKENEEIATFSVALGIAIGLIAIAAFLFLVSILEKLISNRLVSISSSVREIINGNSDAEIPKELFTQDEIGSIATSINNLKESIEKDKVVISETKDIVEKINVGLFNESIKKQAGSEAVSSLVTTINEMINSIQNNLLLFQETLTQLSRAEYDKPVPVIKETTGLISSLFSGITVAQSTMSEVMALIEYSSSKLESSTKELSASSKKLSDAATFQASSLEETTTSIEDIVSTIRQSGESAQKMLSYASNVTEANHTGKDLARKTADSMSDLSNEVNSILDAILVIDQIAFQTNILSLNAAVEAATAGEAGKGFAVVAQEVRNLASRSADAAKEIKEIVERATLKANESQEIADKMLKGYSVLDESINQTIHLIEEVASTAKGQQTSIMQINSRVASLDEVTQQNASLSLNIAEMTKHMQLLVEKLQEAISNTKYNEESKKYISNPKFIFVASKLKSDLIAFKNINFNHCETGKKFEIKAEKEYELGKWIAEHSQGNLSQSSYWSNIVETHKSVYSGIQKVVDLYGAHADNKEIFKATQEVEKATKDMFTALDNIRSL